jgi:hypothetical protein
MYQFTLAPFGIGNNRIVCSAYSERNYSMPARPDRVQSYSIGRNTHKVHPYSIAPRGYTNVQYPAKRQGKSVDTSAKDSENGCAESLTMVVKSGQ